MKTSFGFFRVYPKTFSFAIYGCNAITIFFFIEIDFFYGIHAKFELIMTDAYKFSVMAR